MMLSLDTVLRFEAAFPSVLKPDVDVALECIPSCDYPPTSDDIGPIVVDGEQLRIPFRFYSNEPDSDCVQQLNDRQKLILTALYTRHHDGYVREQQVNRLLASDEVWIPPFVIQLLGEYVLEIIRVLEAHSVVFTNAGYRHFASDNEMFIQLVRQRIRSYWDCYYRDMFPKITDYPAFQILRLIEAEEDGTPNGVHKANESSVL
jgi:site-specific recombinase